MEHVILTDEMIDELADSADDAVVAVSADELRRGAEQARDAALRKIRDAFHARWGWFFKCSNCGARLEMLPRVRFAAFTAPERPQRGCACGGLCYTTAGYAR